MEQAEPLIHMSFLGLFTSTAAHLPWVLLGFSIMLVLALGWIYWAQPLFYLTINLPKKWASTLVQRMRAGHAYCFLEDVYPRLSGRRPLRTPAFIRSLFADEPVVATRPANVRFAPHTSGQCSLIQLCGI